MGVLKHSRQLADTEDPRLKAALELDFQVYWAVQRFNAGLVVYPGYTEFFLNNPLFVMELAIFMLLAVMGARWCFRCCQCNSGEEQVSPGCFGMATRTVSSRQTRPTKR